MSRTKIFLIPALASILLLISWSAALAQSPLPKPTGFVNDYAGVLDKSTKDRLEATLSNLDRQQQIQFAVVTVDTTGGQDIFDYSLAVARGWGIGSGDTQKPSLLLLVAIKDRKYYTHVSRHLEGDLPDGLVGQIQRERLVPRFRAGNYAQGLADTIDTYITTVAAKQGFGTDKIFPAGAVREARPAVRPTGISSLLPLVIPVLLIGIVLVVVFLNRGRGGPRGGSGGWIAWMLVNALLSSATRGSRSSGWSGGGFGGSGGGGSGGGFGGFGGGGDFGGGGAGGSW